MPQTLDIGQRIELVSMDPHFHEISIGLYRLEGDAGPTYLIHSYSGLPGANDRLTFVAQAMQTLGGVVADPAQPCSLRFACNDAHQLAVRRLFLEACKLDPAKAVEPKPLEVFDKKAGCPIKAHSLGDGRYRLEATEDTPTAGRRVQAVARGLAKLGAMDGDDHEVRFGCGMTHDPLVALLLIRAPNVRAVLRESEAAANRGVLTAPSNQNE